MVMLRETRPGNWFAPPGSNQSSGGGDETAGASGAEGREGDSASMQVVNASERRAGPETTNAGAEPPSPACHAKRTWNSLAQVMRLSHRHNQRSDSVSDA